MRFTRENANTEKLKDNVFKVGALAKSDIQENGEELVLNSTLGSLYDEDNKIVALNSVYKVFNSIDNRIKASYASGIKGNPDYLETVKKWVLQDHLKDLYMDAIATCGGTGAISATLSACLNAGDDILIPEVGWSSYRVMCDYYNLNPIGYPLFKDNHFDLISFKQLAHQIMDKQKHLTVIINDPCQNPTGYTLSNDEWLEIIKILNEVSNQGSVVLLNDIAYIDYAKDQDHVRDYLDQFNYLNENIALIIGFSLSKTLTVYGMRLGAAIILSKNQKAVEEITNVFEKFSRTTWSNLNNGLMHAFVKLNNYNIDEYLKEKALYIDLLKKRSEIFISEANKCNLPLYPYKDGFFITLDIKDNDLATRYHEALIKKHIYTIKVIGGIRVAVCSIPVNKIKGLAYKMKEILEDTL